MKPEKIGENIGNGLISLIKLIVFVIILHFAIKYW